MRKEKQYLLDDIKQRIENSKGFLVTQYRNMTANGMTNFRGNVAQNGGNFEVIAKRVFIKAAEEQGIELSKEDLQGHIGIAFAHEDYISLVKEIHKYGKDTENMQILSGYMEGKLYDQETIVKLSKLPSHDQMRAQFLGLLAAPMTQTLGVFHAILTSVLYALENKAKLKSEE